MITLSLVFALFLVLLAELVNGWTDAPNAIATVVSTRALPVRVAIPMAAFFNILGAFTGTAVAATIGQDLINSKALDLGTLSAALIAVIFWGTIAWHFGMPISKSHALISGLTGAGFAVGGLDVLFWTGWQKVII
ncbi:MAG: inorganic phosphate transporter, partial [Bacteroidetes bacterium]|nr:inorganic phosphate transporter [Bacteroidota bacterium]